MVDHVQQEWYGSENLEYFDIGLLLVFLIHIISVGDPEDVVEPVDWVVECMDCAFGDH